MELKGDALKGWHATPKIKNESSHGQIQHPRPWKKLCSHGRAGGMGRRAVWGDAHRCQLPSSIARPPESFVLLPIPESLVVNLGGTDTDGVVPVSRFAPHLGEEELQGPLVDSGVCGCSLTDWGEKREGKKLYSAFFLF